MERHTLPMGVKVLKGPQKRPEGYTLFSVFIIHIYFYFANNWKKYLGAFFVCVITSNIFLFSIDNKNSLLINGNPHNYIRQTHLLYSKFIAYISQINKP